jgi:hypothetical protein
LWETVAPVVGYQDLAGAFKKRLDLGHGLSVVPFSDCRIDELASFRINLSSKDHLEVRAAPAMLVARFHQSPRGGKQADAERLIRKAVVAFWLFRPTAFGLRWVVDTELSGGERNWRGHREYSRSVVPLREGYGNVIQSSDFDAIRQLFNGVVSLPASQPPSLAVALLSRAIGQQDDSIRLVLLWIGLEALFGPSSGVEISHRISERVAFFLEGRGARCQDVYDETKDNYGWRSKVVHGMKTSGVTLAQSTELLLVAEDLVRRSLTKILREGLAKVFSGKARDQYLNSLVFS